MRFVPTLSCISLHRRHTLALTCALAVAWMIIPQSAAAQAAAGGRLVSELPVEESFDGVSEEAKEAVEAGQEMAEDAAEKVNEEAAEVRADVRGEAEAIEEQAIEATEAAAPAAQEVVDAAVAPDATEPDASPAGPTLYAGPAYSITKFELDFLVEPPNAPDISALRATPIKLGTLEMAGEPGGVFVSPDQSDTHVEFALDAIPEGAPTQFAGGAVASVNQQMVEELARQGLGSIIVAPDEADIGFTTGEDLRGEGNTTLRLTIFLPTIKELQSFATGERIPEDEATNHPAHKRILDESPVSANELFWPKDVDAYVARLNRHPGRRVIAQLSPSHDQQQLYLDYQITETKPWVVYASIANSGTDAVGEWQTRVGFVHLQPTNRDDILSLDFVMNTNTDVIAISASYDFPLWTDKVRLQAVGAYADFSATSEDGLAQNDNFSLVLGFEGEQARGGLKLKYNFFQYQEYFVDAFVSGLYEHIETKTTDKSTGVSADPAGLVSGKDDFLTAAVGLALERKNQKLKLAASTWVDFGVLNHSTSKGSNLNDLGRTDPDDHPIALRWDARASFFLDALLADPNDPAPIHAHEFVLKYRGQTTFDKYRVIPHHQQVAGGVETLRGYEQGATAGDEVHLGTFEYRFHLPRILSPDAKPPVAPMIGEFAIAPRGVGERPDWDWVLKAFYDVARVEQTDGIEGTEFDDTLQSVGVGTEVFYKRNVQLRFDWGIGLDDGRCSDQNDPRCDIEKHDWEINFAANFFY